MVWGDLFDKPVFVVTSDQDWTPSWASTDLLSRIRAYGIPLHCFRTNPCPVLDEAVREKSISQGWHPNFLPGSSHGSSPSEVIGYLEENFPGCTTVRSHTFFESTEAWTQLAAAGIRADSQVATTYQAQLMPLLHWTGIVRLPVFFEDDTFFAHEAPQLSLASVKESLFTPGLKIFNWHATFVACNVPSRDFYEGIKSKLFVSCEADDSLIWTGRGTATVMDEIIRLILDNGFGFASLQDVLLRIERHIESNPAAFPKPFSNWKAADSAQQRERRL